ncbi:unnamed protein product [Didymodactylos carnosus]|uniref:Protein kinase domain-containing protein n=1 Tax=Didymodactylos carnosus TaxID=1234261 RepID=A0A814LH94_9BILA|nr:unnamed protein product [Didymodactylos carnosus]CAF1415358.1 unnamed protein product [Didymodactylos carnosus]CAF3833405.1 unnamed protein product [Didymodactylos carnosus]CAF4217917.1 unnamed protein product [Didymodactylos carnosus]
MGNQQRKGQHQHNHHSHRHGGSKYEIHNTSDHSYTLSPYHCQQVSSNDHNFSYSTKHTLLKTTPPLPIYNGSKFEHYNQDHAVKKYHGLFPKRPSSKLEYPKTHYVLDQYGKNQVVLSTHHGQPIQKQLKRLEPKRSQSCENLFQLNHNYDKNQRYSRTPVTQKKMLTNVENTIVKEPPKQKLCSQMSRSTEDLSSSATAKNTAQKMQYRTGAPLVAKLSRSFEQLPDIKTFVKTHRHYGNRSPQKMGVRYKRSQSCSNIQDSNIKTTWTYNFSQPAGDFTNRSYSPLFSLALLDLNIKRFKIKQEIGKGQFGTVYQAKFDGKEDVALKTLNANFQSTELNDPLLMKELTNEANIMTKLHHPNLLKIIGITFLNNNLCLITDYMRNGSLKDYFQRNKYLFTQMSHTEINKRLNNFAMQIYQAMAYLEQKSIVHRDLAARNCLVGAEDQLKVGDFGLAR